MDEKLTEALNQVTRQIRERFFHLELQGNSIERIAAQLRELRREILAEILDSGDDLGCDGKEAEILNTLQQSILLLDRAKEGAHKIAELLAGDVATRYAEWKKGVEASRQS